ncbi:DUF1971 domain-containing protein [Reyranella sp.]|uniref:DUF1971 domain-containing protein n=1 Tax=Reyranella sp. TaxID=1929291 RepID=UPI003BA8A5C1
MPTPYRSTPVFDETTLPAALRREHRTKDGVWGVIRVLEGEVRLVLDDGPGAGGDGTILRPDRPGLIEPQQPHHVEPLGRMRMQVDFYDQPPARVSRACGQ